MGINGLQKLSRQVENINKNLHDNVSDAVESASKGVGRTMKRRVSQNNSIWRGNLYNSIDVRKTDYRVTIVADVPYAAYVEFGTGSSRSVSAPPKFQFESPDSFSDVFPHILNWVETKPFWYGPRGVGPAMNITEKILKDGQDPHPFMRPAWFRGEPVVIARAEWAVKKTISRA